MCQQHIGQRSNAQLAGVLAHKDKLSVVAPLTTNVYVVLYTVHSCYA